MTFFRKGGMAVLLFSFLCSLSSCGELEQFTEPLEDSYHKVSYNPPHGVDLTIKGHATKAMVNFHAALKRDGKTDEETFKTLLKVSNEKIESAANGRAKELWNGKYSIFGYHPDFGKGFRPDKWSDLRTAFRDMKSKRHECLCVTWTPGGTNWTTRDMGDNCTMGDELK